MKVELKTVTPQIEQTIVEIARVSSTRTDKSENPAGLINYLIKNKHWSPFEHGFLTLEIKTSKAIGIQLLRHRSFTFQEFSQRYAEVTDIEPIEFRLQAEKNRQSSTNVIGAIKQEQDQFHVSLPEQSVSVEISNWLDKVSDHLEENLSLYKEGLQLGIAKECTRMILPLATETTIYMTGSVRSWIHLIMIRDDEHAQKEIQIIARKMKEIFKENLPLISEALTY